MKITKLGLLILMLFPGSGMRNASGFSGSLPVTPQLPPVIGPLPGGTAPGGLEGLLYSPLTELQPDPMAFLNFNRPPSRPRTAPFSPKTEALEFEDLALQDQIRFVELNRGYHAVCDQEINRATEGLSRDQICAIIFRVIDREEQCIQLRLNALREFPKLKKLEHLAQIQERREALAKAYRTLRQYCVVRN